MRVKILYTFSLLATLGSCLAQGLGDPSRTTITIGGFTFTETLQLPTDTATRVTSIYTGNGRSTSIGGITSTSSTFRKDTSTSSKSSSSLSLSSSQISSPKSIITPSSTALASTTTNTSSTSKPPPPPNTTSSTQTTTASSSSVQSITSPPVSTLTSSIIKTIPPTALPTTTATPTNPWSAECPVPSNFAINSFISVNGTGGGVSLTLNYGNGTFTCPNVPSNQDTYDGLYDMVCDNDGLTRVITDGFSWIWVQEWYWCLAVPQPQDSFSTLQTLTNYTIFASDLNCSTDNVGVQTCFQIPPSLSIPVQSYGIGGIIGFSPMDVNGNPLSQCTSLFMTNPIVTNTATCTATSSAAAPTVTTETDTSTTTVTTAKVTITIATTQTATVTVT